VPADDEGQAALHLEVAHDAANLVLVALGLDGGRTVGCVCGGDSVEGHEPRDGDGDRASAGAVELTARGLSRALMWLAVSTKAWTCVSRSCHSGSVKAGGGGRPRAASTGRVGRLSKRAYKGMRQSPFPFVFTR